MMGAMRFRGEALLARVLMEAIGMARETDDLRDWWRDHNHLIRSLPADQQARVIAAKDRRKEQLNAHLDEAPPPRSLSRAG